MHRPSGSELEPPSYMGGPRLWKILRVPLRVTTRKTYTTLATLAPL